MSVISNGGRILSNADRIIKTLPTITRDGLIAEWLLNGNVNDTSGSGYNGTPTNITYTTDKDGVSNNAADFSGTSRINVNVPYADVKSISCWILNTKTGTSGLFTIYNTGINFIYTGNAGFPIMMWFGTIPCKRFSPNYPYQKWIHMVFTIPETTGTNHINCKLYINGAEAIAYTSTNVSTTGYLNNFTRIGITEGNYFAGQMSKIRVYNRVLTTQEISNLAQE